MSVEPRPSDSLSQLKELIVGEEQRDLADLRERLDRLEAESVERLARDLAEALHARRRGGSEPFEDWVAALQPGTESAIQRSVTEDKSRLAKALFPIMGPAIRSYVVDLFRGMVEELNETIRNTTSAERIKWRAQARLAGKSYSEYVLLKTRRFRIEEAFLIQRDTGLLLLHAAVNPEDEADGEADLMSGMLTAIRSFVRDSFVPGQERGDEANELDSFTFGEREVLMEVGPSMILAAVAHGVPPPGVRDDLKAILEDLHAELQARLNGFLGDVTLLEPARPTLRRALMENRAEGAGGGGLWRAWVFLGLLTAGLSTWWVLSASEQSRWDRFESAMRNEPGIAVTAVEKSRWGHQRIVRGVRDPLSLEPAELAGRLGIDLGKTQFDFDPVISLEPAFVERRAAEGDARHRQLAESVESLRREMEATATRDGLEGLGRRVEEALAALRSTTDAQTAAREIERRRLLEALVRSQFGDVSGLTVDVTDTGAIRFAGAVAEPQFSSVKARVKPIEPLAPVDLSGLTNATLARVSELESQIGALRLLYADGTANRSDEEVVRSLVEGIRELDAAAAAVGRRYRYEVESHPLIGDLREGNRPIERRRAEQLRERLIEAGIEAGRIEAKLSEDMSQAGQGVGIRLIPGAKEGGNP